MSQNTIFKILVSKPCLLAKFLHQDSKWDISTNVKCKQLEAIFILRKGVLRLF